MTARCRNRYRNATAGFTLLEVMVAMAVLAIATAGVMQVFSSSLTGIGKADLYTEGAMLARNLIEEQLLQPSIEEGTATGQIDDVFSYQIDIVERLMDTQSDTGLPQDNADTLPIDWVTDDSPVHIFQISVVVTWMNAAFPGQVKLETYSTRVMAEQNEK